ncbi:YigZ family protein [Pseudosulfitobacter koreensis]|uniref:YigZ family protein n=1 Tax=Pseudosulfitobacter koreensis TaxID=2968472 RepID=A0ABT1Z2V8_9RHOB|nr:YigZ family protein [Pseudosulfitobacter koreense]MCR8827443.1 YigZ family protein [Pseudosulfitobacter koreense]
MRLLGHIVTDRGSKYAVSGVPVSSRDDIDAALKELKRDKSYAKATHNTWAAILSDAGPAKGDDGEAGAGMVIIRMLEREDLSDHLIVVTRWYGGKHLGGDRFRHVQTCVRAYLDAL